MVLHHEFWRDEIEPWLLMEDMTLWDYIHTMAQRTGHPVLWYAMTELFIAAGFSVFAYPLLHFLIVGATAGLWLFKAPFSLTTRILFLFSWQMAYEYGVINRSYILGIFLLFAALAFYRRKLNWPILYSVVLALLMQVESFFVPAAAIIGTALFWEVVRSKKISPIRIGILCLIMLASGLLLLYQIVPAPDNRFGNADIFKPINQPSALINTIARGWYGHLLYTLDRPIILSLKAGLFIFIGVAMLYLYAACRMAFFLTALSFAVLMYLQVYQLPYPGLQRHGALFFLFLIAGLWLAAQKGGVEPRYFSALKKPLFIGLNALLAVTVLVGVFFAKKEINSSFSGALKMATYLEQQGLSGKEVIVFDESAGLSVMVYLQRKNPDKKLYYLCGERYISRPAYLKHEQCTQAQFLAHVVAKKSPVFSLDANPLILSISGFNSDLLEPVHIESAIEESFYLYKIKGEK